MSVQLVKVPFYGDELDAVERNGVVLVSLRRLCDNLGTDFSAQLKKLRGKAWASVVEITTQMPGSDQNRELTMVDLETLPGWLFSIDARKVAEHVREKLARYQREAAKALADHFIRSRASGFVQVPAEQLELLVGRLEHFQKQLDQLNEQRALPTAFHIPTHATPRTTVQDRLRYVGWPEANGKGKGKIRALIRKQANVWLALRYDETPDVSGGPGAPCVYYGHQINVLDEAIDYVRKATFAAEDARAKESRQPSLFKRGVAVA
jgi:hypothetical protein